VFLRSLALAGLVALAPSASGAAPPFVAHRVVSLIPSLTEDLFAVGAGSRVVGVSAYSDYPPQAKRLPVVSSFAAVNAERIVALHPDVVVAIESQQNLARDVTRAGVPVRYFRDDSLDDVYANLRGIGSLVGRAPQADALVARLRARTAALTGTLPVRPAHRPSVFVVLGTAPVFTVGQGSYIASLIELAGGRNAASDVKAPYSRYSAEALVARQPDVLIVDPDVHLNESLDRAPWNALRAVREHRVYILPDAAILERPGPRYNDGLAWLIETLRKADKTMAMDRAQQHIPRTALALRGRPGGPAQSAGGAEPRAERL
jgi:iron complex transport system substrate-binding protein